MARDKVDVARRANDAYNRHDVDGLFAELATPHFEYYPAIVRALDGGGYRGRDGVERFAVDTRENWEELQTIAEEFRDLGDRACARQDEGTRQEQRRTGRSAVREHP